MIFKVPWPDRGERWWPRVKRSCKPTAAGTVKLDEMIAGVNGDQQACINPTPAVQETFQETLKILRFAKNCGT